MEHLLEAFEETVRRFPEKRAVAYKDDVFSFRELKDKACCLASRIQKENSGQAPVAVLVNRGANTAVGFLAVLYSGTYYIPVDPGMPLNKIKAEIISSGVKVVLTEAENEAVKEQLKEQDADLHFLDLTDTGNTPVSLPALTGQDPIYMVYTSGSTGTPKGVLKSHGAVLSFIQAFTEEFHLTDTEIIGNQTPFFFDASAKDFYLMIYTGATLEVLPSEMFVFPVNLINYMNERQVTYICWVPTALSIVIQMKVFSLVLPETLQKVFFVGEVFPTKQLHAWLTTLPDLTYVNLYGSTEISGICCYYELDTHREYASLPMGRALENCEVFLWNEEKQQIVTEEEGEVCVASEALAAGYFNDPEKTAKAFVQMMTPSGQVRRVLKTGDFARYDEEGNLVFATRKDFQIKHMGRRIELGEIEAAADAIPEIQRCCCLYDSEKKKIHLFCQLDPESSWDKKDVLHEMRRRVSDYMVPSKVTVLEQMPFNANGKIDRPTLKAMYLDKKK